MDLTDQLKATQPEILRGNGETRYKWGHTLAVLVRDGGEIGQFATDGGWQRADVERAVMRYLESRAT